MSYRWYAPSSLRILVSVYKCQVVFLCVQQHWIHKASLPKMWTASKHYSQITISHLTTISKFQIDTTSCFKILQQLVSLKRILWSPSLFSVTWPQKLRTSARLHTSYANSHCLPSIISRKKSFRAVCCVRNLPQTSATASLAETKLTAAKQTSAALTAMNSALQWHWRLQRFAFHLQRSHHCLPWGLVP